MARTKRLYHTVTCTLDSDEEGTDDYDQAEVQAEKLEAYARKLGFRVMYESVDELDPS